MLKLTIELVPRTSWCNNLRNRMRLGDWDKVRRTVYWERGYRCFVCESTQGQLHCHETWSYDDERHVQTLAGFVALCPMCHHAKHIGLARILADEGKLDFGAVVEHFMRVNCCGRADFEQHYRAAFSLWESRSSHPWKVDLVKYAGLLRKTDGNLGGSHGL